MDPNQVSGMVVEARLAQVASKLEQLPQDGEPPSKPAEEKKDEDDKKTEDELLGSPKAGTPTGSPPSNDNGDINKADDVPESSSDAIADRVQTIFGKRRAPDEIDQSEISSKVVNIDDSSAIEKDVASSAPPSTPPVKSPSDQVAQNPPPDVQAVDMELDENEGEDNIAVNNDNDDNNGDDNGDNNMWPVEQDQPEGFPDVGFPIEPPSYPTAPEFQYRYRAGANSTPQRRRLDFERSIVIPNVRRDPHTGRVSQEDYDAREDAEMALSLGYVTCLFILVVPMTIEYIFIDYNYSSSLSFIQNDTNIAYN